MSIIFDVLVIGGGHAGVEASLAASKQGVKTLLVTQSISTIAMMPCNPSIGGPAKGVLVREVGALGGIMGDAADTSFLQTKILNTRKGPGVWAIRNQIDKKKYHDFIINKLVEQKNLTIEEGMVNGIEKKDDIFIVKTKHNQWKTKTLIITTGTYTSSLILEGRKTKKEGPNGLKTSTSISNWFKNNDVEMIRLKTGTPPRLKTSTINFKETKKEPGNNTIWTFGLEREVEDTNVPCFLTHTNKTTHQVIVDNIHTSPLYSGDYNIKGPSRCPSIEDKVVRFKDKERHQIFIEPDNGDFSISYIQGLSSSLDSKTQDLILKSIPAFKNAEVVKYAYAIEYDVVKSNQLKATLEFKRINNLFSAGQINGSSGYEEAAGQGLVAGINAALKVKGEEELILSRDLSYLGMLIDDLITKNIAEPYRLLTSMMTYRMYVRSDNAFIRLNEIANKYNLASKEVNGFVSNYKQKLERVIEILEKATKKNYPDLYDLLDKSIKANNLNAKQILKQPKIKLYNILSLIKDLANLELTKQEIEMIEIDICYEGYITNEKKRLSSLLSKNEIRIPINLKYEKVNNLSRSALDALNNFNPQTIGQARRLQGVTISDIFCIEAYINKKNKISY